MGRGQETSGGQRDHGGAGGHGHHRRHPSHHDQQHQGTIKYPKQPSSEMVNSYKIFSKYIVQNNNLLAYVDRFMYQVCCFKIFSEQALRNSCELLRRKELHVCLCNCMQAYVTACKLV